MIKTLSCTYWWSHASIDSAQMKAKMAIVEYNPSEPQHNTLFQHTPTLFPVAQFDPTFTSGPSPEDTPENPLDLIEFKYQHAYSSATPPSTSVFSTEPEVLILGQITTNTFDLPPLALPGIHDDLEVVDFHEWKSWAAHRCVAVIWRWVTYMAHKYGPTDHWAQRFDKEWASMRGGEEDAKHAWLQGIRQMVRMGWCALGYLEHAIEGELPATADDWRDLYVQAQQLSKQLCMAVGGIECRLDWVLSRVSSVLVPIPIESYI